MEAGLSSRESYLALVLFCIIASASYLAMEVYAGLKPDQSKVFPARLRTWIDSHADRSIIWGGLILGFWLIANSIYLVVRS